MQKNIVGPALIISLSALLLLAGCAGYGTARYQKPEQGQQILESFLADFKEYDVYFTGLSEAYPGGLIFAPRDLEQRIAQKRWSKVEDREQAQKLVRNLERYDHYPPRVYVLEGEHGQTYGYIYTGYHHITIHQLEEDKIHVREMFEPPHLKYDPDNAFSLH